MGKRRRRGEEIVTVAKPSFRKMSDYHFIVTRFPNHWCASSCTITSATPYQIINKRNKKMYKNRWQEEEDEEKKR